MRYIKQKQTSRFTGVSFSFHEQMYKAQIMIEEVNIHLSYYKTESDAAAAYNYINGLKLKGFNSTSPILIRQLLKAKGLIGI